MPPETKSPNLSNRGLNKNRLSGFTDFFANS
jgi:hypothetical protein